MPQLPPLRGWLCVQYTIYYDYSWKFPGYSENLPDYSRIFPDSFNHLFGYYARNYAGIIDACLVAVHT